jgi:hypothetical protein
MWGNSVYTTDLGQPSSKPKVNPVQPTTSKYTMGNTVQGGDFGIHRGL